MLSVARFPMARLSSKFLDVVCIYGAFKVVLTDNGLCFRAKLLKELKKALEIEHRDLRIPTPQNVMV